MILIIVTNLMTNRLFIMNKGFDALELKTKLVQRFLIFGKFSNFGTYVITPGFNMKVTLLLSQLRTL